MSAAGRLRWRKFVNVVMLGGTGVCAAAIASVLLFILGYLLVNGASSINLAFFTELPKPVGESGGGMANAIVGSAKILGLAIVFPILGHATWHLYRRAIGPAAQARPACPQRRPGVRRAADSPASLFFPARDDAER